VLISFFQARLLQLLIGKRLQQQQQLLLLANLAGFFKKANYHVFEKHLKAIIATSIRNYRKNPQRSSKGFPHQKTPGYMRNKIILYSLNDNRL